MAGPVLWGAKIAVSGTNTRRPEDPQILSLKDGTFVAVWATTTGSGYDIRAQFFEAGGTKKGQEFLIHEATAGDQKEPAIALLNDGRFVIAWENNNNLSSATNDIKAQVFTADGTKDGGEITVNIVSNPGQQTQPSVAALSNGGFVVSFTDARLDIDGSGYAIKAQAYDAYGNPFGHEIQVNKTTASYQTGSYVMSLGDSYVVFFDDSSQSPDKPDATTIRGRIFSMEGIEKKSEFVLPVKPGVQSHANACVLKDGRYVVTWHAEGGDGDGTGIRGQIFNPDGTRFNGEFQVNAVAAGAQSLSSVVALQEGGFAIAYKTKLTPDSNEHYLAAFNSNGTRLTTNDLLIATAQQPFSDNGTRPTLTALADGRIVVAWSDSTSVSGYIYAQILDPREHAVALNGTNAADQYIGTAYDDRLNGASGDDALRGEAGNDVIDGGLGRDLMNGGTGDDTYYVDNAEDSIVDASGTDIVVSSISYALPVFLEHLTASGLGAINLTGNALGNTLTGNGAANVLDGGGGSDVLIGGDGDDTYSVDNAGDRIVETSSGGAGDQVFTSVSYTLSDFIENMSAKGAGAISLTGNGLNNILTGNSAANVLNGGTGSDIMHGGGGNDTYFVDNAGDRAVETASGGTADQIITSVSYMLGADVEQLVGTGSGKLTLTGNSLNNIITGNGATNRINGGTGNDKLYGGAGNDELTGGRGKDIFVFTTKPQAKTNKDLIKDWNHRDDTIQLENAIFKALKKEGKLSKAYFTLGSGAKDGNDFIGYNRGTGDLWYDANGNKAGGHVVFANIGKNKTIFHADFAII